MKVQLFSLYGVFCYFLKNKNKQGFMIAKLFLAQLVQAFDEIGLASYSNHPQSATC